MERRGVVEESPPQPKDDRQGKLLDAQEGRVVSDAEQAARVTEAMVRKGELSPSALS